MVQQVNDQAADQPKESSPRRSPFSGSTLVWILVISGIVIVGRVSPYQPVRDFFGSFGWLTEQAIKITRDLFESYGYLTVFLAPLLENTLFLGALIPGTLVMLLAGLGAHDGLISFWPAVLLGISGAIIGDTISYGMGRYGWRWLGPESRLVRWAEEMREPLLGHSVWLVLSYHFAGYSRLVGPAAAGFLRMPFPRWMLLDYIGVSIWVFAYMSAGYLMGEFFNLSLDDSTRNVRIFEVILFAFFIIAIVSVMRASSTQRKRQAEEASDSTTA
ncbi:MAG: DedA family protein [Chloroflexi bacterium]|nr:DedA family protein [Chloroflexota bacterium]